MMTKLKQFVGKCQCMVSSSIYVRWLKDQIRLILACVCIASFLCILTYPGIIYSDSYRRISMATDLKYSIHAFLNGDSALKTVNSWLTVTPSFFILLSKLIIGSIVLYTFTQCFLMFFITYVFGKNITLEEHKGWNLCLITLSPVLWAFGVYYEASIGCVTAIMGILLLIWKWEYLESRFDKIISMLIMVFVSYICFGYRANAFTIIPVLVVIVILKEKKAIKRITIICAMLLGFILTSAIPRALNIDTMSSYAGAFVWETVSTIQSMEGEKKEAYATYLDDIFGDGTTAIALERNTYTDFQSSINSIWWGDPYNTRDVSKPENAKAVLRKYINLAMSEPRAFLKVKLEFISHTLGINQPLKMAEYDYNRSDEMGQFGFNDCKQRLAYVDSFLAYMEYMEIFRRPWILFTISLILILIYRLKFMKKRQGINLYEASYGVAFFYYAGYVLNTQSFEFRYFFPSWLLLIIITISLVADILFRYVKLKRVVICVTLICILFCFRGAYTEYIKSGDELLTTVENTARMLYESDGRQVYFMGDKLYFVMNHDEDMTYGYFLHFISDSGEMINNDFCFEDNKKATNIFGKQIVEITLPKQNINTVEFGQYYGDTKFWETTLNISDFVELPTEIYVSEYTDENWERGYNSSENCLIIEDLSYANYLIQDRFLEDDEGNRYHVKKVTGDAEYLRIYTDERVTNTEIRCLKVVE